jgi:AcrR family transcriptional regulator
MSASETKLRILDAAEGLFADRGFAATSMRDVTGEAGVNLAAVHYHFGSKDALIGAVFARRLTPLNEKRLRLLDALVASAGGRPALEDVLETLIRPAVGLVGPGTAHGSLLTRLLGRVHTSQDLHVRALVFEQFDATTRRYLDVLADVLPHLDEAELVTRFHFLIGAMASSLVEPERLVHLSRGNVDPDDVETMVSRLVTFLAAGLSAPATAAHPDRQATLSSRHGGGLR